MKLSVRYFMVLCLAAACGVLIFLLYQKIHRLPDYGQLVRFDPGREGGHLLPGKDLLVQGEFNDQPVRWRTNSKGFRNDHEFSYEVPKKTKRILFLGDSFVDGVRTDQNQTIGFLLEQSLNGSAENPNKFEVMISGHNNPTNGWYYFQELGRLYHPDLVILGVTLGNDITFSNYGGAMTPYTTEEGEFRLKLAHPNPKQNEISNPRLFFPPEAYTKPDFWPDLTNEVEIKSRIFLATFLRAFAQEAPPQLVGFGGSRRRHVHAADGDCALGLFFQPIMGDIQLMYENFENTLKGMHHAVEKAHGRLLVVLFPLRFQVSGKDWNLLQKAYSFNAARFDFQYPNKRLKNFCQKENLLCLDLLPGFKAEYDTKKSDLYRSRGDMHFNEAGQQLAASILKEFLEEQQLTA